MKTAKDIAQAILQLPVEEIVELKNALPSKNNYSPSVELFASAMRQFLNKKVSDANNFGKAICQGEQR